MTNIITIVYRTLANLTSMKLGVFTACAIAVALCHATPKPNSAAKVTEGQQTAQAVMSEPVKASVDGFDTAFLAPDLDLSDFKDFYVTEPTIEFDSRWKRDVRFDMSERDEKRIISSYTKALMKEINKSLERKTALKKADTISASTLVISPTLEKFHIMAADLSFAPNTTNYVPYVGSARVNFAMKSGANETVLAQLSDHDETRSFNGLMELKRTNRVTNMHDFKRLFSRWSNKLARFIEKA